MGIEFEMEGGEKQKQKKELPKTNSISKARRQKE